jgi:hypothetical protein
MWAKNPKSSMRGSVLGTSCETVLWDGARRWWVRIDGTEAAGCAFTNAKPGGGILAKNPKLSVRGSVSGILCETAVWGGAGR